MSIEFPYFTADPLCRHVVNVCAISTSIILILKVYYFQLGQNITFNRDKILLSIEPKYYFQQEQNIG